MASRAGQSVASAHIKGGTNHAWRRTEISRGQKWWIAYYAPVNGRMVEVQNPLADRKDADERLRDHTHECVTRKGSKVFVGPKRRVTVEELLRTQNETTLIHRSSGRSSVTSRTFRLFWS
jgi:hypothetical protein